MPDPSSPDPIKNELRALLAAIRERARAEEQLEADFGDDGGGPSATLREPAVDCRTVRRGPKQGPGGVRGGAERSAEPVPARRRRHPRRLRRRPRRNRAAVRNRVGGRRARKGRRELDGFVGSRRRLSREPAVSVRDLPQAPDTTTKDRLRDQRKGDGRNGRGRQRAAAGPPARHPDRSSWIPFQIRTTWWNAKNASARRIARSAKARLLSSSRSCRVSSAVGGRRFCFSSAGSCWRRRWCFSSIPLGSRSPPCRTATHGS